MPAHLTLLKVALAVRVILQAVPTAVLTSLPGKQWSSVTIQATIIT